MSLDQVVDLANLDYTNPKFVEEWRIGMTLWFGGDEKVSLAGRFLMPKGYEQALDILYQGVDNWDLNNRFHHIMANKKPNGLLTSPEALAISAITPFLRRTLFTRRIVPDMRNYTPNSRSQPRGEHYVSVPIELDPESIALLRDEHTVDAIKGSLDEMGRILSPSGTKVYTTPHFSFHAGSDYRARRATKTGG